ncbi:hypothetical protein ACP4OV_018978 [Aristida adscensionis]
MSEVRRGGGPQGDDAGDGEDTTATAELKILLEGVYTKGLVGDGGGENGERVWLGSKAVVCGQHNNGMGNVVRSGGASK